MTNYPKEIEQIKVEPTDEGYPYLLLAVSHYESYMKVTERLKEIVPGEIAMLAVLSTQKEKKQSEEEIDQVARGFVNAVASVAVTVTELTAATDKYMEEQIDIMRDYWGLDAPPEGYSRAVQLEGKPGKVPEITILTGPDELMAHLAHWSDCDNTTVMNAPEVETPNVTH